MWANLPCRLTAYPSISPIRRQYDRLIDRLFPLAVPPGMVPPIKLPLDKIIERIYPFFGAALIFMAVDLISALAHQKTPVSRRYLKNLKQRLLL